MAHPVYILQNAELLQAEALGVVTKGWGERSTDNMWVDQAWWMVDRYQVIWLSAHGVTSGTSPIIYCG